MKSGRHLLLLPLILVVFAVSVLGETRVATVTVQDKSAPGSPFAVSGTAEIGETLSGNEVRTSISYRVAVRNFSGRTVLAFAAQLQVFPSFGGPQQFDTNIECFFAADVLNSGQEDTLSQRFPAESVEPHDPNTSAQTPRAEFRVLFVQFLDGSIYGAESLGQPIMLRRRITWKHLRELERTYKRNGEAAFVELLNETVEPPEVNTFFENLRVTQRQEGTQPTLNRVLAALRFAKERQAGLGEN